MKNSKLTFHSFETYVNEALELELNHSIILGGTYLSKSDNLYKRVESVVENNVIFNDDSSVNVNEFNSNSNYVLTDRDFIDDSRLEKMNGSKIQLESQETITFNEEEYDKIEDKVKIATVKKLFKIGELTEIVGYYPDSNEISEDELKRLDDLYDIGQNLFKSAIYDLAIEHDDIKPKIYSYIKSNEAVKEMISDDVKPEGDIIGENKTSEFGYVELTPSDKGLKIELSVDGIEYLTDVYDEFKDNKKSDNDILFELLENAFGNGYTNLTGHAGLTDSPVIGYDVDIDDNGEPEYNEDSIVYWYPDYQVVNFIDELIKNGSLFFVKADDIKENKVIEPMTENKEVIEEGKSNEPYAKGFKTVDGFVIVDAGKEFDLNPLFYMWSEYPKYKQMKDGRLLYSYEFYTDKKGIKYLMVSNPEDITDEVIKNLIETKFNNGFVRNVDTFVENADKEDFKDWYQNNL